MKRQKFEAQRLVKLFNKEIIATMDEMKEALGTDVDQTVLRKLKELSYITSYSHYRQYYTLQQFARFDQLGLWSFESVRFSRYGTLIATVEAFVQRSEAGYFAYELETILGVGVKETLLKLVRQHRVARTKIAGRYLYGSKEPAERKKQIDARRIRLATPPVDGGVAEPGMLSDEVKAAIVLFFSLLDERQRRLYGGLEALKLGYGGDRKIAQILGLDVNTIARGREELMQQHVQAEGVRREGGGRKPAEKKRPKS